MTDAGSAMDAKGVGEAKVTRSVMTSEERCFGTVRVINRAGLHARAATELAKLVRRFEANVRVWRSETVSDAVEIPTQAELVDCRDVLQVLSLGAAPGARLNLVSQGPQCGLALEAVVRFFAEGCGEELAGEGDLPSDAL